jgi:phenylalanyl-tRNA synthetase alpha chain
MLNTATIDQWKSEFTEKLNLATTESSVEEVKQYFLGKTGVLTASYKELASLDTEGKKSIGPLLTEAKNFFEEQLNAKLQVFKNQEIEASLRDDLVDYSVELPLTQGHYNLIQKELARMYDIFAKYGFSIHDGNDIATKHQNFYSVNIPASHPATEIHDTIYLKQQDETGENLLLRTHTSSMQQELIKQLWPECRFVVPGKVYRRENMDATHDVAFWQLEGVCIRKNMSLAHFKHDLKALLSEIFETELEIRLRPGYFPFTEPSYEVDIDCRNDPKLFELSKRRGWLEVLGCGMIHPNVLKGAGVDPEQYTGYAFGFGLTRMVAIKYGIKDVRLLTNGDLRFVQSF